jgi:hypothetical protein
MVAPRGRTPAAGIMVASDRPAAVAGVTDDTDERVPMLLFCVAVGRDQTMTKGACVVGLALLAGLAPAVAAGLAGSAEAAELVAMVEAVEGGAPGVEELEPLELGREVALRRGDRIVLGYLDSCTRETVAGPGVVRIGKSESAVEGASLVDRRTVDCAGATQVGMSSGTGAALRLRSLKPAANAAHEPAASGADAARAMRAMRDRQTLGTATHRQPVLLLIDPASQVVLQPLEEQGESRRLRARESLVDTREGTGPLEPGLWLARRGAAAMVFEVRGDAGEGSATKAERLVRF